MSYYALTVALSLAVLVPAVAFVGIFLVTATATTWRRLASVPLLVLPAAAALLIVRSLVLLSGQSPAVRQLRADTITWPAQVFSLAMLAVIAAALWVLLVALLRGRTHDPRPPD